MTVITFILGFIIAVLVVPAGITSRVQGFTRRKVGELIRHHRGGDQQ